MPTSISEALRQLKENTPEEVSTEINESVDWNSMKALTDELQKHLWDDFKVHYDVYPENDGIEINVERGDWKHDHLWIDEEVGKFCRERGFDIVKIDTTTTEEDGSDTYSATHHYVLADLPDDDDWQENVPEVEDLYDADEFEAHEGLESLKSDNKDDKLDEKLFPEKDDKEQAIQQITCEVYSKYSDEDRSSIYDLVSALKEDLPEQNDNTIRQIAEHLIAEDKDAWDDYMDTRNLKYIDIGDFIFDESLTEARSRTRIRLIWDDCTPTMARRPTTAEDVDEDIHVKNFKSEEEFVEAVLDILGYDEADLEEADGDTDFEKAKSLISYCDDPGDGSPNFLYMSVNGEEEPDITFAYDCLDGLDLEHCTEKQVKKAVKSEFVEELDEDISEDEQPYKFAIKYRDNPEEECRDAIGYYEAYKLFKELRKDPSIERIEVYEVTGDSWEKRDPEAIIWSWHNKFGDVEESLYDKLMSKKAKRAKLEEGHSSQFYKDFELWTNDDDTEMGKVSPVEIWKDGKALETVNDMKEAEAWCDAHTSYVRTNEIPMHIASYYIKKDGQGKVQGYPNVQLVSERPDGDFMYVVFEGPRDALEEFIHGTFDMSEPDPDGYADFKFFDESLNEDKESLNESNSLYNAVSDAYSRFMNKLANEGDLHTPTDGEIADYIVNHTDLWPEFADKMSDPFTFRKFTDSVGSALSRQGLDYQLEESLNEDASNDALIAKACDEVWDSLVPNPDEVHLYNYEQIKKLEEDLEQAFCDAGLDLSYRKALSPKYGFKVAGNAGGMVSCYIIYFTSGQWEDCSMTGDELLKYLDENDNIKTYTSGKYFSVNEISKRDFKQIAFGTTSTHHGWGSQASTHVESTELKKDKFGNLLADHSYIV